MNYYVMADTHGFFDSMMTALEKSGYYADESPKKIIICGDLFDRAPEKETLDMQDFVVDLIKRDQVVLVKGNHEYLIEELVENLEKYAVDGLIYHTHHYTNGTVNTLSYLTGCPITDFEIRPEVVRKRFYNTPLYKIILPRMLNYYETKKHVFVHGWLPCFVKGVENGRKYYCVDNWRNASQKQWEDACWYNGMDAARKGLLEPDKTVVCGHWSCSYGHMLREGTSTHGEDADYSPFYADGIIAIDACTALSKKVNCIIITDEPL